MDKDFLLETYGAVYDPDAGPWNLSLTNKYLEYKITEFFEEHFPIPKSARLCNIGIGAGYWDRYLSYQLNGGDLTSIDIIPQCCRQLKEGLINEKNPNPVSIICSDVLQVEGLDEHFDIVTMVGSTRLESGLFESILEKAFSLVKPGGSFYYQALDDRATREGLGALCSQNRMKISEFAQEERYGFTAQYWKIEKER